MCFFVISLIEFEKGSGVSHRIVKIKNDCDVLASLASLASLAKLLALLAKLEQPA